MSTFLAIEKRNAISHIKKLVQPISKHAEQGDTKCLS